MSEENYTFNVQTELDMNIVEAIKRYRNGIVNSENQLNILLKKKSKLDDNLKTFLRLAVDSKQKIELGISNDQIIITKETKHE